MKSKILFLMLAAVVALNGCAKKKDLENKVSPESYHKKTEIVGTDYHLVRTVEEADSDNTFYAVPGFHYDFGMVKPKITEKFLQFISLNERDRRSSTPVIVASFPILQHFDIAREKNDFGEQTNKIVEETKRPWNEREYIRVDWSQNTISSAAIASQLFSRSTLTESNAVVVEEPKKEEDGSLVFATQSVIEEVSRTKDGSVEESSKPKTVKMRTVFMPVKKSEFKMRSYPDKDFARYGYFRMNENFYNPEEGLLDKNTEYRASIFDVCEGTSNQPCAKNKIVYFLNEEFPEQYLEPTRKVVAEWNRVFQKALDRTDDVVVLDESKKFQIGDPRHNMIVLYPHRTEMGLLGVSQTVNNAQTGETVTARATVYGDAVSSQMGNVGRVFDIYVEKTGQVPGCGPVASIQELIKPSEALETTQARTRSFTGKSSSALEKVLENTKSKARGNLKSTNANFERLNKIGSPWASMPHLNLPVSEKTQAQLTPILEDQFLTGLARTNAEDRRKQLRLDALGIHRTEYVDESAVRFMEVFAGRNKALCSNPSEFRRQLMNQVGQLTYTNTLLHEMGHNFGLRHNFHASSETAELYHPKYKELQEALEAGKPDVTPADLEFYAYSSVMDYDFGFYEVQGGLGTYDLAAIRYGYNRSIDAKDAITSKPYKFCTDHQVGEELLCRRYDKGNTVSQAVFNMTGRYNRNYTVNHFRQGRADFEDNIGQLVSSTISNTFLPVRQVVDEFIYKLIQGGRAAENKFGCTNEWMRASIAAGEIANVCDSVEAAIDGVDRMQMDTFYAGLFTNDKNGKKVFRVPPSKYISGGFADMVLANQMAKEFFAGILGAPEPGIFVVERDQNKRLVLTRLFDGQITATSEAAKKLTQDELRLVILAQERGMQNPLEFAKAAVANIVRLDAGLVAKEFDSRVSTIGGEEQLQSIGFQLDKSLALRVLAIRSYGIRKYDRSSLNGNTYIWPHTKRWATKLISDLAVQNELIAQVPVKLKSGAALFPYAPASLTSDFRLFSLVIGITGFTGDTDRTFLDLVKICDSNDNGCEPRFGQANVTFTNSSGGGVYKAVQATSGDSIAFNLLTSAKNVADARDKAVATVNSANALDEIGKKLVEAEAARLELENSLNAVDSLKPLVAAITAIDEAKLNDAIARNSADAVHALLLDPKLSLWERAVLLSKSVNLADKFIVLEQPTLSQTSFSMLMAGITADKTLSEDAKKELSGRAMNFARKLFTIPLSADDKNPNIGIISRLIEIKMAPLEIQETSQELAGHEAVIKLMRSIIKDLGYD